MFTEQEKRKTSDRPRFAWWLLVVAFAFGVIVTLLLLRPVPAPVAGFSGDNDSLYLTATAIVAGATQTSEAQLTGSGESLIPSEIDPLLATATALVSEATRMAATPPPS